MSTLKVTAITDTSGGNTTTINSMTPTADSLQGFRNRIINGDMRIDQRNAGASVTPTSTTAFTYTLDRWAAIGSQASKFSVQQNAGSVTPPTKFRNYLGATSLSAYTVGASESFRIIQCIEGFNTADLMWGTANAQTVTLSFWVRSSLTGTFGGSVRNENGNRFYPFSYTINAANTWEQKSITITGDTTGTWATTDGNGIQVQWSLGAGSSVSGTAGSWTSSTLLSVTGATSVVGTNGATFYITGVQLEVGSTATPFERRPYGTELALCQRYYYKLVSGSNLAINNVCCYSASSIYGIIHFPVEMRTAPTINQVSGTNYYLVYNNGASATFNSFTLYEASTLTCDLGVPSGITVTAAAAGYTKTNSASSYIGLQAEL